jgi:hypothetical protein
MKNHYVWGLSILALSSFMSVTAAMGDSNFLQSQWNWNSQVSPFDEPAPITLKLPEHNLSIADQSQLSFEHQVIDTMKDAETSAVKAGEIAKAEDHTIKDVPVPPQPIQVSSAVVEDSADAPPPPPMEVVTRSPASVAQSRIPNVDEREPSSIKVTSAPLVKVAPAEPSHNADNFLPQIKKIKVFITPEDLVGPDL